MKTIVIELRKDYAMEVLEGLEKNDIIKVQNEGHKGRKKAFKSLKLTTKGYKFNREEANAR